MTLHSSAVIEDVAGDQRDDLFNRHLGALLAAATADALGWITESRNARQELAKLGLDHIDRYVTWSKPTGGRFHTYIDYVSEGEYSDDTQLTLCTARSLEPDGAFNPDRFAAELKAWLDYARGAGVAITAAARNLRTKRSVSWSNNFYGSTGSAGRSYTQAGGNGVAMRVAPIALANRDDSAQMQLAIWLNGVCTHGHPRAIIGALTIGEAVRLLSQATPLKRGQFIDDIQEYVGSLRVPSHVSLQSWQAEWAQRAAHPFLDEFGRVKGEMLGMIGVAADIGPAFGATLQELGCFAPATKGSGTGTVAAAINAYLRYPKEFERGLLAIVNTLGIDTDTIAAMYGSLVGVRLGSTRIPDRLAVKVQDYEYFLGVAEALVDIALRKTNENRLRVDVGMVQRRESDIVELTNTRTISKNQRVVHPLLGPGWIQSVSEQRTRSGGLMLLADVALDSGQSVRFRSHRSRWPTRAQAQQEAYLARARGAQADIETGRVRCSTAQDLIDEFDLEA